MNWVTLISNDLDESTSAKVKATVAESSSPTSIYTEIEKPNGGTAFLQATQVVKIKFKNLFREPEISKVK